MSTLRVSTLTARTGTGAISIPTNNTLAQSGLVVQAVQKTYNDQTILSTNQVYVAATNGDLSITPKLSNSRFLVMVVGQGYQATGGGCNMGLQRTISGVTTRLIGVDGGAGDSWLGFGNGVATSSWNIKREIIDTPNVAAGTAIQYTAMIGRWASGTIYLNYAGHTGGSTVTILEIAA